MSTDAIIAGWLDDTDRLVGLGTLALAVATFMLALFTAWLARSTKGMATSTAQLVVIETERRAEETVAVVHARRFSRAPEPHGVEVRNDGKRIARGVWVEFYHGGEEPKRSEPIASLPGGEPATLKATIDCTPLAPPTEDEREWQKGSKQHLARCHWTVDGGDREIVGPWERIRG